MKYEFKEQIQEELDKIELTEEDLNIIKNKTRHIIDNAIIQKIKGKHITYDTFFIFCTNIFIFRYKLKLLTSEIGIYYNVTTRAVEEWLNKLDWKYTREEAQQISAKRIKDYRIIRTKGRQTMLNKIEIGSSNIEEYIRQKFNIELVKYIDSYIVGLNNLSILYDGKEIDIPIIVFKDDKIFKFSVEINGDYWHKDKKEYDNDKRILLNNQNFITYEILIESNYKKEKIDKEINDICIDITNIIQL